MPKNFIPEYFSPDMGQNHNDYDRKEVSCEILLPFCEPQYQLVKLCPPLPILADDSSLHAAPALSIEKSLP